MWIYITSNFSWILDIKTLLWLEFIYIRTPNFSFEIISHSKNYFPNSIFISKNFCNKLLFFQIQLEL